MNKIKLAVISLIALFGVAVMVPSYAGAQPVEEIRDGVNSVGGEGQVGLSDRFKTIVNTLLFILGAIAIIMIVIGGVRYVLSNGEASAIKAAKDTILYSVIGLVVAILAYAIVNFVLDAFQ